MGDLGDGLTDLRQSGPHTVVDNLIFFVQDFLHVCPYAAGIESKSVVFFSPRAKFVPQTMERIARDFARFFQDRENTIVHN